MKKKYSAGIDRLGGDNRACPWFWNVLTDHWYASSKGNYTRRRDAMRGLIRFLKRSGLDTRWNEK